MNLFFTPTKRQPYRDIISRTFFVLKCIKNAPKSRFRLTCMLETNAYVMNNILKICSNNGLITTYEGKLFLTEKGMRLLEVWEQ